MEAAILQAAVHVKKTGSTPQTEAAPPDPGAVSRAGNLRAETEWLFLVDHAYSQGEIARTVADERAPSGMDPRA